MTCLTPHPDPHHPRKPALTHSSCVPMHSSFMCTDVQAKWKVLPHSLGGWVVELVLAEAKLESQAGKPWAKGTLSRWQRSCSLLLARPAPCRQTRLEVPPGRRVFVHWVSPSLHQAEANLPHSSGKSGENRTALASTLRAQQQNSRPEDARH